MQRRADKIQHAVMMKGLEREELNRMNLAQEDNKGYPSPLRSQCHST